VVKEGHDIDTFKQARWDRPMRVGDIVPAVVARALVGLHRALIDDVRRRALSGAPVAQIRRAVKVQARRAVAQLEEGLGDYGTR